MFFNQQHAPKKSTTATTSCLLPSPLSAFALIVWLNGAAAAAEAQPLPPNTGMTLVANVAGTTFANDAFWAVECQKVPSNAKFIVVDMVSFPPSPPDRCDRMGVPLSSCTVQAFAFSVLQPLCSRENNVSLFLKREPCAISSGEVPQVAQHTAR